MKEKLIALDRWVRRQTARAGRGVKALCADRERLSKVGFYAALALLLGVLGSASYAYRTRLERERAAAAETPRAVVAVQTPIPTPQPTPEPARWGMPLDGEIVTPYSPEEPLWSDALSQWQTHPALDIAGAPGEAVYACGAGIVSDAWKDRLWGNVIVIEHEDGYRSTYAGLNTLELVEVGQRVALGQAISAVGDSATCEGDAGWHLHFALERDGRPADIRALINP